jgi:hypothetical protein
MSASNSHHQIKQTTRTVDTKENMSDKSRDPRGSEFTHKNPSTHHYTEHKSRVKANPFSRRIHKDPKDITEHFTPRHRTATEPTSKTSTDRKNKISQHHKYNSASSFEFDDGPVIMSESNLHHQIKQKTRTVDTKANISDKPRDPRGSEVTHANPFSTHHYTDSGQRRFVVHFVVNPRFSRRNPPTDNKSSSSRLSHPTQLYR